MSNYTSYEVLLEMSSAQFWISMTFILMVLFAYLLGSIPSGYLAGKWIKGIDLREYGSGTVSGSMVWEHVAKWAVFPVGIFDIFKGALPTWLSLKLGLSEQAAMVVGLAAVVGHNWPIYLNFQGGRGLSPFLGELFVLFPLGMLILLIGLGIGNRLKSPAVPLFTIILLPVFAALFDGPKSMLWLALGMTIITVLKRLEANGRPLPEDPQERHEVILRRIFLDRDIQDHEEWIRREPASTNNKANH
jgi:glycerol-3-phosphate acyltransferase PlsY